MTDNHAYAGANASRCNTIDRRTEIAHRGRWRAFKHAVLVFFLLIPPSAASAEQPWELVWVVNGYGWFIKQGRGILEWSGNKLIGKLNGKDGVSEYLLNIEVVGQDASATFEVKPGAGEKTRLRGDYTRIESGDSNYCWETIHLHNKKDTIDLLRNTACAP